MKKILIIIFSLLLITGCSNYHELNDLAIVSAMGIEKEDNKFKITLELYKELKENNSSKEESTTVVSYGKSIDEAINSSSLKSETLLYFSHIQAIIIDGDYAKDGISDMMDYLSRNTDFSFVSYVVVTDTEKPSDILNKKDIDNEIIGKSIASIFNITEENSSNFVYNKYNDFLGQFINKRKDIFLPLLKVKNKKITIDDMVVFNNDKSVLKLDDNETKTFSLLINNTNSLFYRFNYNDNQIVLRIYDGNTKYKIRDSKIIIDVNIVSDIDEVDGNVDTTDNQVINDLKNKLETIIKKDIVELINNLNEVESDALGLQDLVYDYYGNKEINFKNMEIDVNVTNKIAKKGLLLNPVRSAYEKD